MRSSARQFRRWWSSHRAPRSVASVFGRALFCFLGPGALGYVAVWTTYRCVL